MADRLRRVRWRLVLGSGGESLGGLDGEEARRDRALEFIYRRETGAGRNVRGSGGPGSLDPSQLTVPEWINEVHELFPKRVIERIERDALERYAIDELVTNPALLDRAQPNPTLLKAVLRTKHLMDGRVLAMAKQLVRKVVQELMDRLRKKVKSSFSGSRLRRPSLRKIAVNFNAPLTVRRNLAHYDKESRRLGIRTPYFFSRTKTSSQRWQVVLVVDQSGSMLDSVIHAAVTASIFWSLRNIRTHLLAFDTSIIDLTEVCSDPVEALMNVQLGGGTDIGAALEYAASLLDAPARSIVVLITDLYEGAPPGRLLSTARKLVADGAKLLCLMALDQACEPCYDHDMAKQLVALGAHVGAMTPGELATWVAEKVQG